MEYVSVLAGERYSDHPRCTHTSLALLARTVNDHTSDDRVRSRLALLAPDLIEVTGPDPAMRAMVVFQCLRAAERAYGLAHATPARSRRRSLWRAQARFNRLVQNNHMPASAVLWALGELLRQLRPVLPAQLRDEILHQLLADTITACGPAGADHATTHTYESTNVNQEKDRVHV